MPCWALLQVDAEVKLRAKVDGKTLDPFDDIVHSIPLSKEDIFAYQNFTEKVTKRVNTKLVSIPGGDRANIEFQVNLDITPALMFKDSSFPWSKKL